MVDVSDRKIEIVRTLVETAPDKIVDSLQLALGETGGDTVLSRVRQLVEAEAADRALRNAVFQPVAPLFAADGVDPHRLAFPARMPALLWRGLKALTPDQVTAAAKAWAAVNAAIANEQRPPDPSRAYDSLLLTAAEALRASDLREFRAVAGACNAVRPNGGEALAACLDIAPTVRRTLPRLEDWVSRPGEETGAAARLAYKDAVAIAVDAGPRFFEMVAGQLETPWMVLRIISSVMDKPTERYLAQSELSGFPERVMADIDAALTTIGQLDLDGGPAAGRAAGRLVERITQQTFELEVCIALTRDSGWGKRIVEQKRALAALVEARLHETEKLAAEAMPVAAASGQRRSRKRMPKLDIRPDPATVRRAMTSLNFLHEIRFCATYGGFSAVHTKVSESLWSAVDNYVEEILDHLRTGDVRDVFVAQACLRVAADTVALVREEAAAELVRRRAATACPLPDNVILLD